MDAQAAVHTGMLNITTGMMQIQTRFTAAEIAAADVSVTWIHLSVKEQSSIDQSNPVSPQINIKMLDFGFIRKWIVGSFVKLVEMCHLARNKPEHVEFLVDAHVMGSHPSDKDM